MEEVLTVEEQALDEYIKKVQKWMKLTPLQRFAISQKAQQERGKPYRTDSALFSACLRYV